MTTGSTAMAMEIESLRQQLHKIALDWQVTQQQLADSQKRETLLRTVLDQYATATGELWAKEALAATADFDGLILCEKKPVARKISYGSLVFLEGYAELSEGTQLYRAWEPKT